MALARSEGEYELVNRAARILRVVPEPGWQAIERDVIAAVRTTPRGGWPLDVVDPEPGGARGVLRVSDLALTNLLSRTLRGDLDYKVTDIRAQSRDGALLDVSIDLSCRYLADAQGAALRVRERCASVVADVIGEVADASITVAVTDVHR